VVTGMTGSGKTGLCLALLEEAALQGIPAILVDPKSDLTNLLLHFPDLPWQGNREVLREKISSTVTALLGLVGLTEIDPVRSREHILLSNIFEAAWSQGKDLDLSELILQTQSPPFARLGVFPVETFFPPKDRLDLAMLLNNFLAAPAFQTWLEGQPLDIPALLTMPDGRPRHSIFYIAHLGDSERMFFVTLLFATIEAWAARRSLQCRLSRLSILPPP
jgi:hypothetical protein